MSGGSDLRDLYQEVILDHGKRPRNFRKPAAANRRAEGYNPLCGDRETIYLEVDGDLVRVGIDTDQRVSNGPVFPTGRSTARRAASTRISRASESVMVERTMRWKLWSRNGMATARTRPPCSRP